MTVRIATVTEWDDTAGVGTLTTVSGERYGFQCTAIADGTRTTSVGTSVAITLGPGGPGKWEARTVCPV